MRENKKKEKSYLGIVLISLSLAILFLAYEPQENKNQKMKSNQALPNKKLPSDHLERVNEHLSMTYLKKSLSEAKVENENKMLPEIGDPSLTGSSEISNLEKGLDLSNDNRAKMLTDNLGRGFKDFSLPRNPKEIIYTELFNQDQEAQYSEAYKAAYAKAFVENAKKSGYLIKLDSNYRIISVTPLRNPSSEGPNLMDLSPASPGGTR